MVPPRQNAPARVDHEAKHREEQRDAEELRGGIRHGNSGERPDEQNGKPDGLARFEALRSLLDGLD